MSPVQMNYCNRGLNSQNKARVSRGTQWEIEIQSEYLNKDPNQSASLGIDRSKAKVNRGTQGEIEIRTQDFAGIRANPEPVGVLKGRSIASLVIQRWIRSITKWIAGDQMEPRSAK